ncbi:MAG TPA: transglycosylase SLT domain-containing protein [Gemmatimonadota bacterium]|nr:transglycosylase SLT domain-containing protein [Gemmatimonadota bacterium]
MTAPTPTIQEEFLLIMRDDLTEQEQSDLQALRLARYEPPPDAAPPELHSGLEELLSEQGESLIDERIGYDIPIVLNDRVLWWIDYFARRIPGSFERYLARSGAWLPYLKERLREAGLPEDLAYLALIESGFSTRAVSRAGAVGPWQFMPYTGREYGLRIDRWVDERRDYERATQSAIAYLSDLHAMFGSWYLAAASYNGGQGRVGRSVLRDNTVNFWELTGLHDETRNYVPKLIAATIIAKQPEKYGFRDIYYLEPIEWAKITVPTSTDLDVIAAAAEVPADVVLALNPHLLRGRTPPGESNFPVKIPAERVETFHENYHRLAPDERQRAPLVHLTRAGETLQGIASAYGVDLRELARENDLRISARFEDGARVVIPGRTASGSSAGYPDLEPAAADEIDAPEPPPATRTHRVRRGQTLAAIGRQYGVTVAAIQELNGLTSDRIVPGQRLRIP